MPSELIIKRYYLNELAQASYLIAHNGSAFVIDPRRDSALFVQECQSLGLTLKGVLLTHVHADFVSGHSELSELCGVPVFAGERTGAKFPNFCPQTDGNILPLSDRYSIRPLCTPGHTAGCVTWTVADANCSSEPGSEPGSDQPAAATATVMHAPEFTVVHAFTGDTLLVEGVGRPDRLASAGQLRSTDRIGGRAELAEMMYESTFPILPHAAPVMLHTAVRRRRSH